MKVDFTRSIDWHILALLAADAPSLPREFIESRAAMIEARLQSSKDWLDAEMNNTLITIRFQSSTSRERAFTAAARIC